MAVQVLEEIGIYHNGYSKNVSEFHETSFNNVITVCDSAAEECPVWLGRGVRVHMGFPDPANATGTETEILKAFRQVRDEIKEQVLSYLNTIT